MKFIVFFLIVLNTSLFAKVNKEDYQVVSNKINMAKAFFDYGNYDKSIKILESLLNDKSKLNSSSLLNIYQLISRAEYYNKNLEYAEYYIKLLYLFKFNYQFDPVFINPKFISFAQNVYNKYNLEIIRNKNDIAMLLRKKNPEKYGSINTKKYFYKNFLPFGFGQFQNGHKYKAYMLIGIETISLITSITTYVILKHYQRSDYTFEDKDLANTGKIVNNISFYTFLGIYVYATIDGVVYYNASNINVIQSGNFEISPIITGNLKYVSLKWRF